jgi:hypothetical protein
MLKVRTSMVNGTSVVNGTFDKNLAAPKRWARRPFNNVA